VPQSVSYLINAIMLGAWVVLIGTVLQLHFCAAPAAEEEPLRHPPARVVEPVYHYQFADKPRTQPPSA
jgi:hypothetical protein